MTPRTPGSLLLSEAEVASLRAIARHDLTRDAASSRMVSEQTLKNELSSAYRKLGVRTRTGAFRTLGWLSIPARARALHDRSR